MNGKDYVALRRLSTRDNATLAIPGETCDRVPAASLPALLASGKIRLAPPTPTRARHSGVGDGDMTEGGN